MLPYCGWGLIYQQTTGSQNLIYKHVIQQPPLVVQNVAWILLINLLCVPCLQENNKEYFDDGKKVATSLVSSSLL